MEDYRKIAIELGNTLISKAPETREDVERMLPELKESEDERMKKVAIEFVKQNSSFTYLLGISKEEVIAWLEKQGKKPTDKVEQKPAWSKNDEMIALSIEQIFNCASLLNIVPDKIEKVRSWLKNLKDRVQPKQEWSEKDETALGDALWCCKQAASIAKDENDMGNAWYAEHWLKSLRPQNRWKPSELQIEALESATANCAYSEYQDCLRELIGQLKKLKKG